MVLGLVGLIDQGELDCKVLAIEVNEAHERGVKNIADYDRQNPGAVKEVIEWFRNYKVWEGKKINEFKWDGEVQSVERSLEIIQESSQQYQDLLSNPQLSQSNDYWQSNSFAHG